MARNDLPVLDDEDDFGLALPDDDAEMLEDPTDDEGTALAAEILEAVKEGDASAFARLLRDFTDRRY